MKKIAIINALCLFAVAVVTAGEAPTAQQNTAGNKRSSSPVLLKTEPNNAVIREVVGRGGNRDEAVKRALYRAVEQVRGVRVDSSNYEFGFRSSGVGVGDDGPGRRRIEFDSVNVATDGTVYTTEIGGLIRSYNVLDEKQIDETHFLYLNVSGEPKEIRRTETSRSILHDREYTGSFTIAPYEPEFIEIN